MPQRDTSPGPIYKGYEAAKARLARLLGSAKGKAEDAKDAVAVAASSRVGSGAGDAERDAQAPGAAPQEADAETAVYEEVVPQDARTASSRDAGGASADTEKVEIASPELRQDAMQRLDDRAVLKLGEQIEETVLEDRDGLGLDDAPSLSSGPEGASR